MGLVAAGDLFGGAERQILALARAAEGLYEPVVMPTLPGPLEARVRAAGVPCAALAAGGTSPWRVARRLAETIDDYRIDVLHTHGYRPSFIVAAARLLGARRPVVRTVHGLPETRAHRSAVRARMAAFALLERSTDRLSRATVVYVSNDLKRRDGHGRSIAPRVVRNGDLPINSRPPRPAGWTEASRNIVAVGRLELVKGFAHAVRALASPGEGPAPTLHILGDGPERDALEEEARGLGIAATVQFHGFVPDPIPYLAHADALVVSSLHEGIPYVILEAMQLGTPIVATRVGGIPEVLEHDVNALLVPPCDPPALRIALDALWRDPALGKRLSDAAQSRFAADFTAETMARRYAEIYRQALGRSPKSEATGADSVGGR